MKSIKQEEIVSYDYILVQNKSTINTKTCNKI